MIKTNIKLRVTPEQSKAVQEICFANSIYWLLGNVNEVKYTEAEYLFIDPNRVWFRHIGNYNTDRATEGYEEVDADLFIRTNGTCVEPEEATIEECKFVKYGFEKPYFDCEIWKVETSVSFKYIHGLVLNDYAHPMGNLVYHKWNKKTGEVLVGCSSKNLTPIKKPWYETCKIPCLVKSKSKSNILFLITDISSNSKEYLDLLTPLTNEEIEELKQ